MMGFTKDNYYMINEMDMAKLKIIKIQFCNFMKENGKITNLPDQVNCNLKMENIIKDTLLLVLTMDMGNFFGKMDHLLKESM